jgi:hypothetical protein
LLPLVTSHITGAFAQDVDEPEASQITQIVARGFEVNSTSFGTGSVCSLTSGTTYPTPSAAFVTTEIVDGATATGSAGMIVTPISSTR